MGQFTSGPEVIRRLREAGRSQALAQVMRLQALSCIQSARHGWLGASFSCAELLTVLYFDLGEERVVLSKGHAAAMQYACLHGLRLLTTDDLLAYKDGPSAPQAHPALGTPGILLSTGSLGQALSQVAGMAWARPGERFFVILGDGELQEGQVWEALQTVVHHRLHNLCVVLDRNGFQSEQRVAAVKGIADLEGVIRGMGYELHVVDGHDCLALRGALAGPHERCRFVIADTVKAGGSRHLAPQGDRQPWHGRVPGEALYRLILGELVDSVGDPALGLRFQRWLEANP